MNEWQTFGLDSVEMVPYDVLLSYPNASQPNYISVVDRLGNEVQCMPADEKYMIMWTQMLMHR